MKSEFRNMERKLSSSGHEQSIFGISFAVTSGGCPFFPRCSMIVIVTRGHRFDAEVLEKSLQTDAGYIGMIGSRKKISAVYAGLKKLGFTEKDFMRVKAPIGLPIKAETPEEIAVSIIAEIIRGKAALENV